MNNSEVLLVPGYEVFGSDEWSTNAEAIHELSPHGYVAINEQMATALDLKDWDTVIFSTGNGSEYCCYLRVDESVAAGIAVVAMACSGTPAVLPDHCLSRLNKAETALAKPPQVIASDRGGQS
jgi:1-aminocyclopropane-1-carboxylate deaminase/D-cysteine desulfhydrase-like pyridoxal-dependent ACC family enzyme